MENGIYAASLTPLKSDLTCDTEAHAQHCKDLIEQGCKGVVLFGTTGEGPSFPALQRIQSLHAIIERGLDPKKIILSVGCPSVEDTVQLAQAAAIAGCAAVLMMPPYFYKNISDEGVIAFYREVIRKVHHPALKIILYHYPQLSGVPINLNVVRALQKEFPTTVIGMKESEGNFELMQAILKEFSQFKVFVGNETMIADAISIGAAGAICGIANISPQLVCSLVESKKRQPEIERVKAILKNYSFIPAAKAFLQQKKGAFWALVRAPLISLTEEEKSHFITEFENIRG